MAAGLTRSEQIALVGVAVLIVAGISFQNCNHSRSSASLDPADPRWEAVSSERSGSQHTPGDMEQQFRREVEKVSSVSSSPALPPDAPASKPLNLNNATVQDLEALPGIGPVRAQAILVERSMRKGFKSVDDLLEVKGIGEVTLEKLRPFVTLGDSTATSPPLTAEIPAASDPEPPNAATETTPAPSPPEAPRLVNINTAGLVELQKIPGVGPALAGRIIQARQVRQFTSPSDLIEVKGIGPRTFAKMKDWVTVE